MQTQKKYPAVFSFEFFPPRSDEGVAKLRQTRASLARLNPRFFSVTFGAGGSTRDRTLETVLEIQSEGLQAAPHLSCIGSTRDSIREILERYRAGGISHLVALRGDLPSGAGAAAGEFRYANELVEFIRAETGDQFRIEVACYPEFHPQADSAEADLKHFKRKVDAGADAAITQYFFNCDGYFRFIDACEALGVDIPVVPGIMPILNYKQLARFSDACGAEIPRWLRKRLESFGDDRESIIDFGTDVVSEMCERLLAAGAPGLHFYTMNQAPVIETIWRNLGLQDAALEA